MKSFRSFNLFLFLGGIAAAQTPPASSAPTPEDEPLNLEALIVTGSPFTRAQDEIVPPTTVLGGRRLAQKRQPTLGETLADARFCGGTVEFVVHLHESKAYQDPVVRPSHQSGQPDRPQP